MAHENTSQATSPPLAKRYRWYFWIGVFLAISTALYLLIPILFALAGIDMAMSREIQDFHAWVFISLLIVTVLWCSWLVGLMTASREPAPVGLSPKRRLRSIQLRTWIVPLGPAGTAAIYPLHWLAVTLRGNERFDLESAIFGIAAVIALVLGIASYFISKAIDRRYRANICRQRICLGCGYDLRATETGKCPECGEMATFPSTPPAPISDPPST